MKAVEMMGKYATSYFTGEHADFYKKESNPKQPPLLSLVFGEDTYVVPAPCFDGATYSPFGRCTRNSAVVLLKDRNNAEEAENGTYGKHGQILYLKEYWREESMYTKKESEGTWQFMSANLKQNPTKASHTVVDDRESALHVLTYMALRHLRHNAMDERALEGKLFMFDDYISLVGKPDVASAYQAMVISNGGPEVDFVIPAVTLLIQNLCEFFAPRYIGKYDRPAGELELMSEAAIAKYKIKKDEHQQNLYKLLNPASDFVYTTMRSWAAKMPEPPDNTTQDLKFALRIPIVPVEQAPAYHPDVDERKAPHVPEEPTDGAL
ncbi:hypothetical protein EYR38_001961 [Pleurotus pulmonarius]|nr:hypothetical protein EYR38_001961 [Pleurotus pulmonarius]